MALPVFAHPQKNIDLFFDTGHHFFFIPIGDEIQTQAISAQAIGNQDRWHIAKAYEFCCYKLWIDPQFQSQTGILVCLETNREFFRHEGNAPLEIAIAAPLMDVSQVEYGLLKLNVRLSQPTDPKAFNLYVDLGNTRTMALLAPASVLNDYMGNSPLPLYPVHFLPKGWTIEHWHSLADSNWNQLLSKDASKLTYMQEGQHYQTCDSWLVMVEPQFSGLHSDRGNGTDDRVLFCEFSPAVIGGGQSLEGAKRAFMRADTRQYGELLFLSAPKRVVWDDTPVDWFMLSENVNDSEMLPAESLAEFRTSPSNGENDPRSHRSQKRDAIAYFALGVLEAAWHQLRAPQPRSLRAFSRNHRMIHRIVLTFPGGWTSVEKDSFASAWEMACSAFAIKRKLDIQPKVVPLIHDEAVTAQVPYAYAEKCTLGLREWMSLYGRVSAKECSIRVLNVDIGGGTTDLSIITYSTTDGDTLKAKTEFTHSHFSAGDSLVQRLIQEHVLGTFIDYVVRKSGIADPSLAQRLANCLKSDDGVHTELLRAVNIGFVPIVYDWFQKSSKVNKPSSAQNASLVCLTKELPEYVSKSLNDLGTALMRQIGQPQRFTSGEFFSFEIRKRDLRKAVQSCFAFVAQLVGELTAQRDCDTVFLSGKVCEMLAVKQLFRDTIPLHRSRLIFSDECHVGNWYPLGKDGRIRDSKSLSVVGAAILDARLLTLESIPPADGDFEWYISRRSSDQNRTQIQFGPDSSLSVPIAVEDQALVWRKLAAVEGDFFELVYRLDFNGHRSEFFHDSAPMEQNQRQTLRFERDKGELKLADFQGSTGASPPRLVVRRAMADAFWKDNTKFLVSDCPND